jgi:hypothetical protein
MGDDCSSEIEEGADSEDEEEEEEEIETNGTNSLKRTLKSKDAIGKVYKYNKKKQNKRGASVPMRKKAF